MSRKRTILPPRASILNLNDNDNSIYVNKNCYSNKPLHKISKYPGKSLKRMKLIKSGSNDLKQLNCDLARECSLREFQDELLKTKNKEISEYIQRIKSQKEEIKDLHQTLKTQKYDFKSRDESFKHNLITRINHIDELTTKNKELEESLNKLKNKNAKLNDSFKVNENDFKTQIKELNKKVKENKLQINKLKDEIESNEDIISDLKKSKRKIERNNMEVIEELNLKHSSENKIQNIKIEKLNDDINERDQRLKKIDNILKENKNENFKLMNDISGLEAKLTESNKNSLDKSLIITELNKKVENLNLNIESSHKSINKFKEMVDKLNGMIANFKEKSVKDDELRRKMHNTIQELKGNIRVYCRVRPFIKEDNYKSTDHQIFTFPENNDSQVLNVTSFPEKTYSGEKLERKKWEFSYDRIFKPSDTQENVFEDISQLVQSALDGYKVCIFAYGQTGSGKTYTMEGPPEPNSDPSNFGMIFRSINKIFSCINLLRKKSWNYQCKVMFVEIYNEKIRDLLNINKKSKKLEIKNLDESIKETVVTNANYIKVNSVNEIIPLLKRANLNRSVGKTNVNEHSSRSHSVFQINLIGSNEKINKNVYGCLNLIDLAGSERLKKSKSTGLRLKEAQFINKSLSALNDVIVSLNNGDKHIPYRNSCLTHLLANHFGGDSKTLMFVNLSPVANNLKESLNSLRFASTVNSCHIGTARQNVRISKKNKRI